MPVIPPSYVGRRFFALKGNDVEGFLAARDQFIETLEPNGVFAGDNLVTWGKTLGFLREAAFVDSLNKQTTQSSERSAVWRTHTLVWAARQVNGLAGDFVECACYRGTTARIVTDMVGLEGRKYWLYDLFDHDETMPHHAMPAHSAKLFNEVRARFPEPNVVVTQGRVPDVLQDVAPESVALLHLDLNNRDAEIGVLELLWDRIVPGGIVILDDFGWIMYAAQHNAEREWFAARGYPILELPTGQGMVVKRP